MRRILIAAALPAATGNGSQPFFEVTT